MNNFQTILTAIFLAFFVFAVLIFSGLLKIGGESGDSGAPTGKVVVWGTFSGSDLSAVFDAAGEANKNLTITYVRKNEATYQQDLIEAFANGTGPDLFLITPAMVQKNENLIYKIPFANYPEKSFRDSFVDGADVYLAKDGVVAFPIVVDPIVMYYNKDIIAGAGLATPPKTWDQLFPLNSTLTKRKDDGTISQSMIALGQYDNVSNAKDVLATLLLQSGNPIVSRTDTGYVPVFNSSVSSNGSASADQVINFFTEFSNPSDSAYSWNRSLPKSIDMFTGGKLAFYLGHASELFTIQSVNPNLSFDVTTVPQIKDSPVSRTYGTIYALAVSKKSQNPTAAFGLAGILTTGDTAKSFAASVSLPPASRALLSSKPENPYLFTFFTQALVTRTWLDPDKTASDAIFSEMIQNVLSSKMSTDDAVNKAQGQLVLITKK